MATLTATCGCQSHSHGSVEVALRCLTLRPNLEIVLLDCRLLYHAMLGAVLVAYICVVVHDHRLSTVVSGRDIEVVLFLLLKILSFAREVVLHRIFHAVHYI